MYYYALLLNDGTVLRVSKSIDNLAMCVSLMPVMEFLPYWQYCSLSLWQDGRQTDWSNRSMELDLERPLDSDIYEELSPFAGGDNHRTEKKKRLRIWERVFRKCIPTNWKRCHTSISGYAESWKTIGSSEDISGFRNALYQRGADWSPWSKILLNYQSLMKNLWIGKRRCGSVWTGRDWPVVFRRRRHRKIFGSNFREESVHIMESAILDEMVYNVCENAVKYNCETGKVSVWREIRWMHRKSVSDTGRNSKEHQNAYLSGFTESIKSFKRARGTGLGLSIVKHGALLHEGKVSVKVKKEEERRSVCSFREFVRNK